MRQDRRPEPTQHRQFNDVFEDEPATDIPSGTLAKAINAWANGNKCRPRNGSVLWTSTRPPAIAGRTGYAAHTDGQYIVSDSGPIFTPADVSYLLAWEDGYYDEIVEFITTTRVRRRDTTDTHAGIGCWIQGKLNLNAWHKTMRKWVIQLGDEFWIVNYEQTQWTKVLVDCYWGPANAESSCREDGDYMLVANSRFIYRVILDGDPPIAYPVNSPNIDTNFLTNTDSGRKLSRYNYLISMSRLDGSGNFRHRMQDPPPKIMTESGTTRIDENRKDWVEISTEAAIDAGTDTYGQLDGGPNIGDQMSDWDDIGNGSFNISINGQGFVEFVCDFRSCKTLYDVAQVIQDALQNYFPTSTCEYVGDDFPHFRITSGRVDGGTVSFMYDGSTANNIAGPGFLAMRDFDLAVQTNPHMGAPVVLRNAIIPSIPWISFDEKQRWPTHYTIYRTPDYGPVGTHLDVLGERVVNSPEMYIWNKDLRVCGSFIARRLNGVIQLRTDELGGEFEQADQGCIMEFEDSSRVTLNDTGFIDSKNMRYGAGGDVYYGDNTDWMAATIGEARVCRVSQTGDVVTVYPGSDTSSFDQLTSLDVDKRIYWPNGTYSYIKARISDTQWQVYDSATRTETACAVDPKYRAYCDIVNDDQLIPRSGGLACRCRLLREVKQSNTICLLPGFVVFAARGEKDVRYCPSNPYYKQFIGYHNRDYQSIELSDKVVMLWDFTSLFAAFCQASIHSGQSGSTSEISLPGTQQMVWQIAAMEKRADVGLIDHGAVTAIGRDMVRFVSNMHEVIDFNGWDFQQEIIADATTGLKRWWRSLRRSYPVFAAMYSQVTGYILWWVRDRRIP